MLQNIAIQIEISKHSSYSGQKLLLEYFVFQSELARQLDDEEYDGFQDTLGAAREVGYNLDEHYGKEVCVSLWHIQCK